MSRFNCFITLRENYFVKMTNTNDALRKIAENRERPSNGVTEPRANENSDEDEYVRLLRNRFDRSLFPSDFDERTVSERYSWINKNLSKF